MAILPRFKQRKATQLACCLLQRVGGSLHQVSLMKLLYFVDRESLNRWKYSITSDDYFSMEEGPVLSQTYDLIKRAIPRSGDYWESYIDERQGADVVLLKEPDYDALTEAEIELADEIFDRFGHMSKVELVDYAHKNCPEWRNPQDVGEKRLALNTKDILLGLGMTGDEAQLVIDELEAWATEEAFFA